MRLKKTIFVAGHRGMVGSAIVKALSKDQDNTIIVRDRTQLDLTQQRAVIRFFEETKIDEVYLAAAKVGGIFANNEYPGEFIYENLAIQTNVIDAAFRTGIKKLLFLGSSCIYPKFASQPIGEDALLTAPLEETNAPYAVAKIAGIKLCESYNRQYGISHGIDYRSAMPTNLYGPGDNYHPQNAHVIPALIRRFHEAKLRNDNSVSIWGTGTPRREFLYVDDLASAVVHIMNVDRDLYKAVLGPTSCHINVGFGSDITIAELTAYVANVTGYEGSIQFDKSKPDGTPRKLLNSEKLNNMGWWPSVGLREGLQRTYVDFQSNYNRR